MRITALIDHADVIQQIPVHLNVWDPRHGDFRIGVFQSIFTTSQLDSVGDWIKSARRPAGIFEFRATYLLEELTYMHFQ